MPVPPTYDFSHYKGDEFDFDIRLNGEDGNPEDLTGKVALSQIKADKNVPEVMATITCTIRPNGVGDVDKGKIRLFLPHDQADQLVPGPVYYDVQVANDVGGDGRRTRLRGTITVEGEVTT